MAKKSAARAKAKSAPIMPLMPQKSDVEEMFERGKDALVAQLEVQVQIADRVDNLANLRDLYISFWKVNNIDDQFGFQHEKFMELLGLSIGTYEAILSIVKELTFANMEKEELADPFEGLLKKASEIENQEELLDEIVKWLSIQPYANKVIQLHSLIQDELAKIEEPEENDVAAE